MFENTKTTVCISEASLAPFNTQLHSEFAENDTTIILTLANGIRQPNKEPYSVFDVDCVQNCTATFTTFRKDVIEKGCLATLHETNKKYFFGLLREEFLEKLKPEY